MMAIITTLYVIDNRKLSVVYRIDGDAQVEINVIDNRKLSVVYRGVSLLLVAIVC